MRARFALKYAGITCYLREVSLKNKPEALLDISPKGTVPVLQLNQNMVIEESLEIIRWALRQHDPENYLQLSHAQQDLAELLIKYNDTKFIKILHAYKYHDLYPDIDYSSTKKKLFDHLNYLNNLLNNRNFLVANNPSIADIALFPFIRQIARINEEEFRSWPYDKLILWLDYFLAHPAYKSSMKKYPIWQTGPGNLF
jgi:glutathione S-transferase